MKVNFVKSSSATAGTVVVGIFEEGNLGSHAQKFDQQSQGMVAKTIQYHNRFKKNLGEFVSISSPSHLPFDRLIVAGLGKKSAFTERSAENVGGHIFSQLISVNEKESTCILDEFESSDKKTTNINELAAHIAYGMQLKNYRFSKYKTSTKPQDKPILEQVTIVVPDPVAAKKFYEALEKTLEGIYLTRNLVSEPGNVIYPKSLAEAAQSLTQLGVKVEVLGVAEMKKLGMNSLLGVGQGSAHESQLLVMEWPGADKAAQPVAIVGKGVTFDSGGISIKAAANMEEMKTDMAGAATVIGLMRTLAARKSKARVVGLAGLVENMPSGTAQRPGDVVTSMSGQTIEVINTDAEGRLVLADVLWYCQQRFKPKVMIDLATLTGAIVVALGHHYAGLFSNNQTLVDQLIDASKKVSEPIWHMPLHDHYDKMINSDIADVKNSVNRGSAGSITAAHFLQRFVKDTVWAHLDIAGVAWTESECPTTPKGATGFGVRLLNRFIADQYE